MIHGRASGLYFKKFDQLNMRIKSQITKKIINFLCMILLTIFLIEGLSWCALYLVGMNGISYEKIYDPINNTATFKGVCKNYADTLQQDPYLGFVHNRQCSGNEYRVNNIGLLNQDIDSLKSDTEKFRIGIFGGSVAMQFAGIRDVPIFQEILNSCYQNKDKKPFVVYNFSDNAWKQPQQVIALTLFQDYLDAAISIEGFNEHYLIDGPIDMIYPPNSFYVIKGGRSILSRVYSYFGGIRNTPLSYSNFLSAFTLGFRNFITRLESNKLSVEEQRYVFHQQDNSEHNFKRYVGFVRSFEGLAKTHNIYSLVVIQPTPLMKKLTPREAKVVGNLDYKESYLKVIKAINTGASNVLDLSDLFMNSSAEIFSDPIHFLGGNDHNSLGNYEIALSIASKLKIDRQIYPKKGLNSCLQKFYPN